MGCDCVGVVPEAKMDIDPTGRKGEDVVMKDGHRAVEGDTPAMEVDGDMAQRVQPGDKGVAGKGLTL